MMNKYPPDFLKLITLLRKLPGVGLKTAERFAFQMLKWPEDQLKYLGELIASLKNKVHSCSLCGCLMEDKCFFCHSKDRDLKVLCVVSSPKDVYVIEETKTYFGLYHVLGGLLSPLEGKTIENLQIESLKKRILEHKVDELILALDSTIEGDTTALFLKKMVENSHIAVSRLALGLPMGSSLDFVDGGTLARALSGRQSF